MHMKQLYILKITATLCALIILIIIAATEYCSRAYLMFIPVTFMLLAREISDLAGYNREENAVNKTSFFSMNLDELKTRVSADRLYLGEGFLWEKEQAGALYRLLEKDPGICRFSRNPDFKGSTFIQALGPVQPVYLPLSFFDGHTLIAGTTGAGKTRLYDLLCAQAIYRGEGLIVIDPKGDRDLYEHLKYVSAACNRELLFFHPAFSDTSIGINPLHSFTRSTEIASRVSALVPTAKGNNDPFRSFAFTVINTIVGGLKLTAQRPTLKLLRYYSDSRISELCFLAYKCVFDAELKPGHKYAGEWQTLKKETSKVPGRLLNKYDVLYQKALRPYKNGQRPELEALFALSKHDAEHYKKMIASLKPVLDMLTSGEMGSLLSPEEDSTLSRKAYSLSEIVNKNRLLYVGLDSLTDGQAGAALGSILLADLTAVAGARYNYGNNPGMVNLFVDETAEVVNEQLIQLLNKGRGAKFRITIATQTVADFESRLGSSAKASQVLGNVNNLISLRVIDKETREYISESLPKTRIMFRSQSAVRNQSADELTSLNLSVADNLTETEMEIFPASMLAELPDLEFIARVGGSTVIKGKLPFITV